MLVSSREIKIKESPREGGGALMIDVCAFSSSVDAFQQQEEKVM